MLLLLVMLAVLGTQSWAATTITYLTHFGGTSNELAVYQKIADEFNAQHQDITVEIVTPTGSYLEVLRVMIAGGISPDLTFLANWDIAALAEEGLLEPLEMYVERDGYDLGAFFPLTLELSHYLLPDGQRHLYALPRHPSPIAMYYNVSAYNEAGLALPPSGDPADGWTWDTYLANSKRLTVDVNADGTIDHFGTSQPRSIPHTLFPVIRSFGGGILDDVTRSTTFNDETREAIQWVADLSLVERVAPRVDAIPAGATFESGFYNMQVDIFPRMVTMSERIDDFDWNIAPMPSGKAGRINRSVAGTHAVLSTSKNPEAAWEFLKFLASDRAQTIIFESGVVMPSRIDTARRAFENPPTYMADKNINVFIEGLLGGGQTEPVFPEWRQLTGIFSSELGQVWNGRTSVESALNIIARQVDALLKD